MTKIILFLFVMNCLFCKILLLYQFIVICLNVGYAQNNIILMDYFIELITPQLNQVDKRRA
ncbi:hypothetical protein EBP34_24675 [Salmonella enterica subsp. enterica serovar Saintpaul]|nr:hypothetical protein [Salmonella enterica subsp. enterica serovar Saintpaul]